MGSVFPVLMENLHSFNPNTYVKVVRIHATKLLPSASASEDLVSGNKPTGHTRKNKVLMNGVRGPAKESRRR